jgi:hypothetical protein
LTRASRAASRSRSSRHSFSSASIRSPFKGNLPRVWNADREALTGRVVFRSDRRKKTAFL